MRPVLLAALSALVMVSTPVFAQTDAESKAAAEVLFRDGIAAFDTGDYARACPKLEGAVELTRGEALGGLLYLGRCYEGQGKIASAWGLYREVATRARASGQTDRATEAVDRGAALQNRLHYVTLHVPAEVAAIAGVKITRQGKPVQRELWTSRFPIDPGPSAFEISAPGKITELKTVAIPVGPGDTPVPIDPLADAPSPVISTPRPDEKSPTPHTPSFWTGTRVGGAVIAGIGALGMGAGGVVAGIAKGRYGSAVSNTSNCTPRAAGGYACVDSTPADQARSLGNVATAVFLGGTGVLVGGALILLIAPSAREAADIPLVNVGRDGLGITWTREF